MNTKEKIIEAAIMLFNQKGVSNVTSRHISDVVGISNGNFCYHYPNKESLLISIHEKMVGEISPYYQGISQSDEPSMIIFNRLILFLDQFNQKYLFFSVDVLEMTRNFPEVASRIKSTAIKRRNQIEDFFVRFQEEGMMIRNTYKSLKQVVYSTAVDWNFHRTVYNIEKELSLKRCLWKIIKPHLTEKGKIFYNTNISDLRTIR